MQQNGCDEYLYNGTELDQYKQCGVIPNSIGTSYWEYSYDNRGNLTGSNKYTRTTEGMKMLNVAAYVYDETNRLVSGKNEQGEYSLYTYNGLGVRVGRELIMQDNTHGYTDFHDLTPSVDTGLAQPEVVKESYVVDYTTATRETLTMHEEGGFDYRWVYGLDRLSVKVTSEGTNWWGQNVKQDILKDYAHQDRMGSTTNLTDQFGRVVGRADYNEWGELTYKEELNITSAYRRIYPQASYTGHDWDDVLGMYYAKARFYDPAAKRFVAMDPIKGSVVEPLSLVPYIYCVDNPLRWVDPLGLMPQTITIGGMEIELTDEMAQKIKEALTEERRLPEPLDSIYHDVSAAVDQIAGIQSKSDVGPASIGSIQDSELIYDFLYVDNLNRGKPYKHLLALINDFQNSGVPQLPVGQYVGFQGDKNGKGQADELAFGLSNMATSGCEVIATYNALVSLGERTDFQKLIHYYTVNGSSLLGYLGTSPIAINGYFQKAGFCTEMIMPDIDEAPTYDFDAELSYGQAGILTYWTDPNSLYIHTIMIKRESTTDSKIRAYNYSSDDLYSTFDSIAKLISNDNSRPISLITVDAKPYTGAPYSGGAGRFALRPTVM